MSAAAKQFESTAIPDTQRETSFAPLLLTLACGIVLAGFNRLTPFMGCPLGENPWIRWREFTAMFFLTPMLSVVLWKFKQKIGLAGWRETTFLTALIILAVSMGIHEPMNAMKAAKGLPADIMAAYRFWDDALSHYAFFLGFAVVNLLLVDGQLRVPRTKPESSRTLVIITLTALAVAGVIFRNMAFEPTTLDIATGMLVLTVAVILWIRRPVAPARAPLAFALVMGYAPGFGGALLVKIMGI